MKRRFIATIMVLCFVFSLFTVTSSAASNKKTKYIKVKASTYQTYKKVYTQNKTLKKQIKSKDNAIKTKNKTISNKDKEIEKLKADLEAEKSKNNWVWMNIYSLGISYNDKTWSVPKTIPSKFMINGTTYYANWE